MPRFALGDRVRILGLGKPGHVRTPVYVRGATGAVERYCGASADPEDLAYGRDGLPRRDLSRVRVALPALWPEARGAEELEIEVYDHWLAPVEG